MENLLCGMRPLEALPTNCCEAFRSTLSLSRTASSEHGLEASKSRVVSLDWLAKPLGKASMTDEFERVCCESQDGRLT